MADLDESSWRTWNRFDWSKRLLEHYFGRPELGPVRSLNVSDQGLAAAVDDAEASGEEVRAALVASVLRASGPDRRDFFEVAMKGHRHPTEVPYLAHLVVSCIAAVGSGEVDEAGFINRFIEQIDGLTNQGRLDVLAKLWRELSAWLSERPEYRDLELPDPGGWTRIGYSVRLAFPSRSDQRSLQRCFEKDGLVDVDPSTGSVIASVARGRTTFSDDFWTRFEEFRQLHADGVAQRTLLATPFWSAVELAAGVTASRSRHARQWTLLAQDDGFDLELSLATNQPLSDDSYIADPNPFDERRWPIIVTSTDESQLLSSVLSDEASVPFVSGMVRGGVLPFLLNPSGQLELARRAELPEVEVVLASDSVLAELQRLFASQRSATRASRQAPAWSVVRGLQLSTFPAEALEGGSLSACQILQDAPLITEVRILHGVRLEDGFLGHAEFLPMVSARGAVAVALVDSQDSRVDLRPIDGEWSLPRRDLDGEFTFVVNLGDHEIRRRVVFYGRPASEMPKRPKAADGYLVEYMASAIPLTSLPEEVSSGTQLHSFDADVIEYLGRDVGVFLSTPEGAAWAITRIGSASFVRRIDVNSNPSPQARVEEDGLRRRWRKALDRATSHPRDPEARQLARRVAAAHHEDLPLRPDSGLRPVPAGTNSSVDGRTDRVLEAVVAITNRRLGLGRGPWRELLRTELGVDGNQLLHVARAWSEAGFVQELLNVRSGMRVYAAVQPALLTFRTDDWYAATLLGTVLPSTRKRVLSSAKRLRCAAFERAGCSPFVPPIVSIRTEAHEDLDELGRELGIRSVKLPDEPALVRPRDLSPTRPSGYEQSDFGQELSAPEGARITRFWRPRSPMVWAVESDVHTTWTHFEHSALFWAHAFAGKDVLAVEGAGLAAEPAVAPLGLVRWLTGLSGRPPGVDANSHKYVIGSPNERISLQAIAFTRKYVDQVLKSVVRIEAEGHS